MNHSPQKKIKFCVESGIVGGIPAPGLYFGSGVYPEIIESSRETFQRYEKSLNATILGFLQVDSRGSVNVSRRGVGISGAIGPGGFIDICDAADLIIFIGTWMVKGEVSITDGKMQISKPGQHKFVSLLDEITFNAPAAIERGKKVYYVTEIGLLQLSKQGLVLKKSMPGIDIQRDIIRNCPARIIIPDDVVEAEPHIITGKIFNFN